MLDILLRLSGPEMFPGISRNGPHPGVYLELGVTLGLTSISSGGEQKYPKSKNAIETGIGPGVWTNWSNTVKVIYLDTVAAHYVGR